MESVGIEIKIKGLKALRELEALYKEQLKILEQISDVNSSVYKEQERKVSALVKTMDNLKAAIDENGDATKDYGTLSKDIYNKLSLRLTTLRNSWKGLSKEEKETSQSTLKDMKKVEKQLKDVGKEVESNSDSVGDYKDAFKSMGGGASSAMDGVEGVAGKLSILAKHPVVAILGLMATLLGGLAAAFSRSEKGAVMLNKASGFLNGVMSAITDVAVKLVEWMEKLFVDNLDTIQSFGEVIEKQVLNRVYGLIDGFGGLSSAIVKLVKGDFEGAKKAFEEAGDGLKNAFTGEENIDGVKGKVEEFTKKVVEQGVKFSELNEMKRQASKANLNLQLSLQDLLDKESELLDAVSTQSEGIDQRIKDEEALMEVRKAIAKQNIAIAKNDASVLNQEIALRKANGEDVQSLMEQQVDALVAVREAERDYKEQVRESEREIYELRRDGLERTLDFLIDGVDNFKSIQERQLKDERLTYEQRQEMLKKLKEEFDDSFKEQVAAIEFFTGKQIDANDLIGESNANLLDKKVKALGLDDVIAGRLLEIIRDRRTGLQDLDDAEVELQESHLDRERERLELAAEVQQQINEYRFGEGIISQEAYSINSLQIEKDLMESLLELEELKGDERLKLLNDIQLKEQEIKRAAYEQELSELSKKEADAKYLLSKRLAEGTIEQEEYEKALSDIEMEYAVLRLEKMKEGASMGLELLSEVSQSEVDLIIEKNRLIEEEEERMRDRRIDIARKLLGSLKGISDDLFAYQLNKAEGNEEKERKIKKRQFKVNKAVSIANATIDTYVAFNKNLAAYPFPLGPILAAVSLAQGLVQVASIARQQPSFASGGYTGPGAVNEVGGVVHKGEVVFSQTDIRMLGGVRAVEGMRPTSSMRPIPSGGTAALLEAMDRRFDRLTVISDSEAIVKAGLKQMQLKKARSW